MSNVPGFDSLSRLAYEEAGLVLSPLKATMIQSRLRHRLKALNLNSLEEYCSFVRSDTMGQEKPHMISALTTNVSSFFREPHHFEIMKEKVLPELRNKVSAGQSVRIWSAGCSNGQEPYSIAMLVADFDASLIKSDFKILASDIDQNVLDFARRGIYSREQTSGVSSRQIEKYFSVDDRDMEIQKLEVSAEIKSMISFRHLNLIQQWPMKKPFNVIFCRNVVIYFDAETQRKLWQKFHSHLGESGVIFVGHSERITVQGFDSFGSTGYIKSKTIN